jgi:hypothetical protein
MAAANSIVAQHLAGPYKINCRLAHSNRNVRRRAFCVRAASHSANETSASIGANRPASLVLANSGAPSKSGAFNNFGIDSTPAQLSSCRSVGASVAVSSRRFIFAVRQATRSSERQSRWPDEPRFDFAESFYSLLQIREALADLHLNALETPIRFGSQSGTCSFSRGNDSSLSQIELLIFQKGECHAGKTN